VLEYGLKFDNVRLSRFKLTLRRLARLLAGLAVGGDVRLRGPRLCGGFGIAAVFFIT
jgi:hypothetical protein